MDTAQPPSMPELHSFSSIEVEKENKILTSIRLSEFADEVENQEIIEFIDAVARRGDTAYGLALCRSVRAGMSKFDLSESVISFQIEALTAEMHLLNGNDTYDVMGLESILDRHDLSDEILGRIQAVLSMIYFARGQLSNAVSTALSVMPRLEQNESIRLRVALDAATYMSLSREHGSASELLRSVIDAPSDETNVGVFEPLLPLRVLLAFTSVESGNYAVAKELLDDLNKNDLAMSQPAVHNAIVHINALYEAAIGGVELGEAIQKSLTRFVVDDDGRAEGDVYRAWLMVQSGRLGAAHAMFKKLVEDPKALERPASALLEESALTGFVYTSRGLHFADDAREMLGRLNRLHTSADLTISTSGLLLGIESVLMDTQTGMKDRLQFVRNLRRRGQYSHGSNAPLVQRAIEIECSILNDGGLYNDELPLRLLLVNLETQSSNRLHVNHVRNRLHLAILYTDMAATDMARSVLQPALDRINDVCEENDELDLLARYIEIRVGVEAWDLDSIDAMGNLQHEIETNLGAVHPLNARARFTLAKAWQLAGNNELSLDHLLSIESGSGFASANRRFKLNVMSEIGDTLSALGQYKRAAKWYKICVKLPGSQYDLIDNVELEKLVKYGEAMARAGDFSGSRNLFGSIPFVQGESVYPNVALFVRAKASAAASAESMGSYALAAAEYSALVSLMTEHDEFNEVSMFLASLYIAGARNFELINDRESAYKYYVAALDHLLVDPQSDQALISEIMWRRDCCQTQGNI